MPGLNRSLIGAQFGNSDGATQLFALGQHAQGDSGSEWVYVQASGALSTGQCVVVTSGFLAAVATLQLAIGNLGVSQNWQLAFAQGNFAASDYGWVAIKGTSLQVALSTMSTLGVPLYIQAGGSGALSNATATSGTIAGVIYTTVSATGVTNANCNGVVTYPRLSSGAFGS